MAGQYNCDSSKTCVVPPESAVHVAKWIYALVGLGIATSTSLTYPRAFSPF